MEGSAPEASAARMSPAEEQLQVEINSFIKNLYTVSDEVESKKACNDVGFTRPRYLPEKRWLKEKRVMIGTLSNFSDVLLCIPPSLDMCKKASLITPVVRALHQCHEVMYECMTVFNSAAVQDCLSFPDITWIGDDLAECVQKGHLCVKACARITRAAVKYIDTEKRVLAVPRLKRAFELCYTRLRICKECEGQFFINAGTEPAVSTDLVAADW